MALENYFRDFEDVLTGRDERDPWPTKEDLKPGRIYIDQKSCLDVQSFLDEHRYCLVEGAERRGKTTLVRFVGLQYIANRHVYRIDVSLVSDSRDLDDFIHLLKGGFLDRPDTLIIAEDCHIKPQVTEKLIKAVEKCQEARFLFTMRTVKQAGRIPLEDPFEESVLRQRGWVVRLDETKETIYNNIKGIVERCLQIRSSDLKRRSTKAVPTSDDYKYLVGQTGGNKRILNYYLQAWLNAKDPDLSLRQVDRNLILEQFHKERLKALNEVQLEVVLIMSALGQFEVPIVIRHLFPSSVSNLDFDRAADELNTLRGLAFRLSRGAWLFPDTESRLTLECMEYQKRIDNRFVYRILNAYVKEAANYYEVFHLLSRAGERNLVVLLAEDTEVSIPLINRLKDTETTLAQILFVLRAITWADKTKGLSLWHEYKKVWGEQFVNEFNRKLLKEENIQLVGTLLFCLTIIDQEGEAIPLAKGLPTELFATQIRQNVGFSSFAYLEKSLLKMAPEKEQQLLEALNSQDYLRLGNNARDETLYAISWFLSRLVRDEKLEAFAADFLSGIGRDALIKMASESDFGVINYFKSLAPEKYRLVISGFILENYVKLRDRVIRGRNLGQVYSFICSLASDEQVKESLVLFLNAIGEDQFFAMLNRSSISTVIGFKNLFDRFDIVSPIVTHFRVTYPSEKEVIDRWSSAASKQQARGIPNVRKHPTTEEEWIDYWSLQTVGPISRRLWYWARSLTPATRERGKKLVKQLASADVALRFGEAKEAIPIEKLGWLLFDAYYLDEEAAKDLALKVATFFDTGSIGYSLEHLVFLLKNSRWCNPNAALQLVEKIFSSDAVSLLSKGGLDWFCQLLWEAVLSNKSRTREWVTEANESFWEDLAVKASPSVAFHLLLVLWQANENLGTRVTHAVGRQLTTWPELMDNPETMALLGFFAFCDLEPQKALSFSPTENADKLCIHPVNQRLACSLFYLQGAKPEAIPGFIKAILAFKDMTPGMALLLAEYTSPWTVSALTDILVSVRSEGRTEREDVYDRILFPFGTIRKRVRGLGTVLNEMCALRFAPQSELTLATGDDIKRQEEKRRSWAIIRLANAIDKGIFIVQETEHPITHKASRLLSLNWGHPQVTFAFDITRNLLLALHDAQKGKGWAYYETWRTSFGGSWKEEPLSAQQLRYWVGILLKMNLIEVDYKETNEGKWVIAFRVNSEHPLTESLIIKW